MQKTDAIIMIPIAEIIRSGRDDLLEMAYQPKIDSIKSVISGYESLLRWKKQDGCGYEDPELLVGEAEAAGDDVANLLLEMIVNRVAQLIANTAKGARLPVSVNMSPFQVGAASANMIIRVSLAHAIDHKLIEVEVTEHAPVGNILDFNRRVLEMRSMGFCIWLDDFGVGYSTLSNLAAISVDGVKLDNLFMRNSQTELGKALVFSVVSMCHTMNLKVVIEGVETPRDHAFALFCGADFTQGYVYGRPVVSSFSLASIPSGDEFKKRYSARTNQMDCWSEASEPVSEPEQPVAHKHDSSLCGRCKNNPA